MKFEFPDYGRPTLLKKGESEALAAAMRVPHHPAVWADARDRLIRSNVGLVFACAWKYRRRAAGLSMDDLVGYGMVGLVKAADGFDPARGVKFSSYATVAVKKHLYFVVHQFAPTVRVPYHFIGRADTLARTVRPFQAQADAAMAMTKVSDPDTNTGLLDRHPAPTPADHAEAAEAAAALVGRMLAGLPPRTARLLRARYGLDGGPPATTREAGVLFGVCANRVLQIEANALRALASKYARPVE